jgi:predicted DNA-binding helix-hairpin-helix protein
MDGMQKLALFKQYMDVEIAEEQPSSSVPACEFADSSNKTVSARPQELPIHMAALPNGQRFPMLKTLLTSACERNCNYCAFRAGRNFRRETLKPDEMADTFHQLYQKRIVQGMFLSSGVAGGGIRTQDQIIDTAEILRNKLGYRGYLHLKIMPGAEKDQVQRAMQLADRVSVNLEGPNNARLNQLAPQKVFIDELLQPLRWVEEFRASQPGYNGWNHHWPSSVTQFVVGAVGEHDLELLRATAYLHQKLHLARVYFSGFRPVMDTPFENQPGINPWREHRLYQAAFLLRDYGFVFEEMPFTASGDLPLDVDPKLAWARANLTDVPLEVNRADSKELLRIPGIGLKGARAILAARRKNRIASLEDLKALGIRPNRAAPFILLNGKRPPAQLSLW